MRVDVYNSSVSYGQRSERRKKAEKEVVTGAGVTGAAVQANRSRKVFDVFASNKKLTDMSKTFTGTAKKVSQVTKQSTGLWAKVGENFKWAKGSIIKWGEQFKNLKYIKPLVESAAFRGVASLAGLSFGLVTFISGAQEIVKTAVNVTDDIKQAA